jgi:5-methylcytosine-specific restriction protein B
MNSNFIQESFIKWFFLPENHRSSYDGLVSVAVLNFWNQEFFDNQLFSINTDNVDDSLEKLALLIKKPKNPNWPNYNQSTSKGSPSAVLGPRNFLKFLNEFFQDKRNIKAYINSKNQKTSGIASEIFSIENFLDSLQLANLSLPKTLPYRFVSALQTKPFVILTGLSGSGKTKLAEAFSLWISESAEQYCMVSVGADWTNREPLLGFPNALESGKYVKPDCGALDLILRATKDENNRPYFLILDEMNMSHVERYFADFLSAMESTDAQISLHSSVDDLVMDDESSAIPRAFQLPNNLFIIGTVNIDETTYMFSPKVLDRANVIEFRVSETEMSSFFTSPAELDMRALRSQGASMGVSFVEKSNQKGLVANNLGTALMPFFTTLQDAGAEFGYRSAAEISRFVKICGDLATGEMNDDEVIDAAIIQKLLPKVHGSRNKIEKTLKDLACLCLVDKGEDAFQINKDKSDKYPVKYPLSYDKLKQMHKRVLSDGFTSFAEA